MPYIGSTPTTQNFISGTDYFNGTGAQTAFTLTRTVNSVNDIQVVVNNVVQQPNDAYTLSGTTLTFTSAPSSGTNNVYVRYLSTTLQSITPSYGSIIPSMLNPPNTIYWNTSGNVGIGTTSPTARLGIPIPVYTSSSTGGMIRFQNPDVAADSCIQSLYVTGAGSDIWLGANSYVDTNGSAVRFSNSYASSAINLRRDGTIDFSTNSSSGAALQRMRIDSNGDVCIGTTSSVFPAANRGNITIGGSASSVLTLGTGTTNSTYLYYDQTGKDFYLVNTSSVGACIFYQSNAERMRISALGFLKASNTGAYFSPSSPVHELRNTTDGYNVVYFIHGGTNPYGPYIRFSAASPNNSSNYYFYCDDTVAARFIVYSNGNVVNTNGSYGAISDIKNKENIVDATPKLNDVMQLKVRNFNFKTDPDLKQIGFVAQEFEEVFPSMVEDTAEMGDDGKPTGETSKTIKMSVLIPILTKAIQEQQAMIEELKARIETLEAK